MTKNTLLLVCGKLVSVFGAKVFSFSLSYYILSETGSALSFSISLAFNYIPQIFISPFAGMMADKFNIKKIIVICDFLSAAVIFSLIILKPGLFLLYVIVFILACISSAFAVAIDAGIPTVYGLEDGKNLKKINAAMQTVSSMSVIIAPVLSGLVITVIDIKYLFIISGIGFTLSAFSEIFIQFHPKEKSKFLTNTTIFTDLKATISYIKNINFLKILFFSDGALNFFYTFGVTSTVSFIALNFLKMTAWQMGMISSALSVGSITASFFLLHSKGTISDIHKYPFNKVAIMAVNTFLYGVCVLLIYEEIISTTLGFLILLILFFSNGFLGVLINVPVNTAVQLICSEQYRGKVFGTIRAFGYILTPIAMLLSGNLLDKYHAYIVPIISGCLMLLTIIFLAFWQKRMIKEKDYTHVN